MGARPNFFILGAPKCGTTSLANQLAKHPQIGFSSPKEPKFFNTDFSAEHRQCLTEDEYLRCFASTKCANAPAVGEATVWYLYSSVAIPNILEFNPNASFIVLLRNPVDLAHSLHSQLLYGGDETVTDFEEAWHLQTERKQGHSLPLHCREPKVLLYRDVASQGTQVERLCSLTKPENVRFFLLEDLMDRPALVLESIMQQLGISSVDLGELEHANPSRQVQRPRTAAVLRGMARFKRHLGIRRSFGIWRTASPIFSSAVPRSPLGDDFRARLSAEFSKEIDLLEARLGRDLSRWRQ